MTNFMDCAIYVIFSNEWVAQWYMLAVALQGSKFKYREV